MRPRPDVDPEDAKAARAAALALLARRDHPAGEVVVKLQARGFSAATATAVAHALVAERLVNDERFVENFIAYHAGRGQGPLKVRAELRHAGVDPTLIDAQIEAYGQWDARAREARQKKFGAGVCDDYGEKARQSRFLAQRGFTGAQIRAALDFDPDYET